MKVLIWIWTTLNNRKALIGGALLLISALLAKAEVIMGIWGVEADWIPKMIETLNSLGMGFGGVGFIHKAVKHRKAKTEGQLS